MCQPELKKKEEEKDNRLPGNSIFADYTSLSADPKWPSMHIGSWTDLPNQPLSQWKVVG